MAVGAGHYITLTFKVMEWLHSIHSYIGCRIFLSKNIDIDTKITFVACFLTKLTKNNKNDPYVCVPPASGLYGKPNDTCAKMCRMYVGLAL